MPFARPTPQAIRDRLAAEVAAALPGSDPRLRRSVEEILVRVVAVASHELHGHLAWAARQILPDSAEAELLDRHAGIWGISRRAAAAARGPVTITGTIGAVLPAGAEMRRADDASFTLDADVTIGSGGSAAGAVTAAIAGAAGNTAAASTLTLVAPAPGIAAAVTVAAGGIAAGADIEADAALRARVLARIQAPPAGGNAPDYVAWAQAVPGVGRVFVHPLQYGAGTVAVLLLTAAGGIPATPLLDAVAAAIEAERPVTAQVTVLAPTALTVDLSIEIEPDTVAARAAVLAATGAFFAAEASPGQPLRLSRLSGAISAAAGEVWHRITIPVGDVVPSWGQLPVLGTVTWL